MAGLEFVPSIFLMIALVCGSLLLAARLCLPFLLLAAGVGVRRWIEGGPWDLEPVGRDPAYDDLYRQLLSLDFRPLGVYYEAPPFGPRFRVAVFGLRGGECFAGLMKLSRYDDPRLYFLSATADGAIVYTKNFLSAAVEKLDYVEQGLFTADAGELLELHRAAVERLRSAGHRPVPRTTLEDFLELEDVYYGHPHVRSRMRRECGQIAGTILFFLCFFPSAALLRYGPNGPAPWLALLGMSLAWVIIRELALRAGAHHHPPRAAPAPREAESPLEPVEPADEAIGTWSATR